MKHTAYLVKERTFIKSFGPLSVGPPRVYFEQTKFQSKALVLDRIEWWKEGVVFTDNNAGKDAIDPVRGKGFIGYNDVVVSYYDPEGDMSEEPLFVHDCNSSKFLGTYCCPDNLKWCDLYHCLQFDKYPTVIARWGLDGDYSSGMCFADGTAPSLTEAKRRAIKMGLPVEDLK